MPSKIGISNPGMSKVLERQVRNWELSRSQKLKSSRPKQAQVHDFITITNNVGAGGGEVADMLGQQLGWPVYDRQVLKQMALDDKTRTQIYQNVDERYIGLFEQTWRSLMQAEFRKNDYFPRLVRTILWLGCKGPAVFVGRSTDLILPWEKGLRIKVYTSLQRRIENFALQTGLSPKEAVKEVERIDMDRTSFIRNHFHMDVNDPSRFNLMINLERFTNAQAAGLILAAHTIKQKEAQTVSAPGT